MPESQAHGKTWERDLGLNVYRATAEELGKISHTAPIDVPRAFNRLDGIDISIKVKGKPTIDMGDIMRVYDETNSGEPYHMTVVEYEQTDPTTKKVKRITEVDLTNSATLLFGDVTHEQLKALDAATKAVGKVRSDVTPEARAAAIAAAYAQRDVLHGLTRYMHFHLMFYTNNPSRVQGQFKDFARFLAEYPERVVATGDAGSFRGGAIAQEIISPPRQRNKKAANTSGPRQRNKKQTANTAPKPRRRNKKPAPHSGPDSLPTSTGS